MHEINQQMRPSDIIILVILSILWGGSFFFVEVLVDYLKPLTIVTMRVGIAAIALWIILAVLKAPLPKERRHWAALLVVGILNNALPFSLIVWGQTHISSGLASILNATTPFFTVLVAGVFLLDEKITRGKLIGVLVGLAGTVILIGPDALRGLNASILGQLAVMGAGLSYAFATDFSRRFKSWGIAPIVIATGQVTMASLVLLPLTLIIDKPYLDFSLPAPALGAIIGLSIFSTVIAYTLFFRLVSSAGATNTALVTFLIPISAILMGVTILGESFNAAQALGMSVIGLGLLIIDGRLFKKRFPPK